VSDDLPLDQPPGDALVDRARADALRKDYRHDGEVRVRHPGRRRWGLVVLTMGAMLVTYYLVTLGQVVRTGGEHGAAPSDAIIVMGAAQYDGRPSPQLAARLDHVVALWDEGVAPVVVVTGGKRPGDRFTEAEASSRYLVDAGIPADVIVEVGEGATTHESVEAAAPVMSDLGIEAVALVTDPYHALRSRLIVEGEGFAVDVATTPDSVVTGRNAWKRNVQEAAGVAVGRIIGFDRLSDLTR
jgi:uncharacterized SAM-binding protein YcdF (DUF218 family)